MGKPAPIRSAVLTNCTFTANTATQGGALYTIDSSYPTVNNCILWNDGPDEIVDFYAAETTVRYSDIMGGFAGEGNINLDPKFADAGAGDLRILASSPCIDAGDTTVLPGGVLVDLAGAGRGFDDPDTADTGISMLHITADIGAFEFQPLSSCVGDVNADGFVDVLDLIAVLSAWGPCP